MAETPKKTRTTATKTTAKPRKTPAKKATNGAADPVAINGHVVEQEKNVISHEEVAVLAHSYWQERGHKHGHHIEDWFRAEQELRGKAS